MAEGYSVSGGHCPLTGHGRDPGTCGAKPRAEGPEPCPGGHSWMPLGKALPLKYQHPGTGSPLPKQSNPSAMAGPWGCAQPSPLSVTPPTLSPPLGTPRTTPFLGPCSTAILGEGVQNPSCCPHLGAETAVLVQVGRGNLASARDNEGCIGLRRIPKPSWVPMGLRTGARAGCGSTGGGDPNCPTQAKLQRNTAREKGQGLDERSELGRGH